MISVCMATYNGEKYIQEQLQSILKQLSLEDEVIISDDGSTDHTIDIIQEVSRGCGNVRVISGPGKGVVRNFENAISQAQGDVIFLSDQDDIWEDGKVETVLGSFRVPDCLVVVHDASIVDKDGKELSPSFFLQRGSKPGLINNIIKNSYIGCCMAFRRSMCSVILPFPERIEMHDWWIGLVSELGGHSVFIPERLIKYRRHGENVSSFHHHPVWKMIYNRLNFCVYLLSRALKVSGKN